MSFICVDFYGARQMAGDTGLAELEKLARDLEGIAADVYRACDQREQQDNDTLFELRPDYGEVLK